MALGKYGKWSYDMVGGMYRVFCGEGMQTREYSTLGEARQVCQEMHIRDLEIENAELRKRDVLTAIVTSTQNLYARFGVTPTRVNTLAKVKDETKEFIDELKRTHIDKADLADEFGDYEVVGTMAAHIHLSLEDMIAAIWRVIAKNDAKTTETHVVVDGIITRKDKVKQVS